MSVHTGERQCSGHWAATLASADRPLLQLLGPVSRMGDQAQLRLTYRKGWALLAYLVLEQGRNHRRSDLAALLWPTLGEAAALTNLRQVLCDLRRRLAPLLGPDQLLVDRHWVRLRLDLDKPISDVQMIDDLVLGVLSANEPERLGWLLECGELLEGCDLEGADEFGCWLYSTRQWCQLQWRRALERLRAASQLAGDWRLALECVRCQLRADPWDETLHRQRMMLYSAMGDAQLALASYGDLERVLQRELGVGPQRETTELAGLIRGQGETG